MAGMDVLALLPKLDDLLVSPHLMPSGLSRSTKFRYFMRVGYEQVERVQDISLNASLST